MFNDEYIDQITSIACREPTTCTDDGEVGEWSVDHVSKREKKKVPRHVGEVMKNNRQS